MPTVRSVITQALKEIGVCGQGETPSASDSADALLYLQNQLDAWQAEALTLAVNTQLTFTTTGSAQTFTIGPSGDINAQRPVSIETMTYVNPGSSPEVETLMAPMNDDQYDALSIKALPSSLPTQYYYNTSFTSLLGTLFIWPLPTQAVKLYIYVKQGAGVPVLLTDTLQGPAGYAEAFMYQLALRLVTPFSKALNDLPLLPQFARESLGRIKRANLQPGFLGVDAALAPSGGFGYDILNDTSRGSYGGR